MTKDMKHNIHTTQPGAPQQGEIILYQPDETVRLEVRLEDDTVWLTQQQMAELFQTTKNNVTLHIGNVYKEHELVAESTSKESLLVRMEGNRQVTRQRKLYNQDVIISVGYRVKSQRGTQFRQWANRVIKEYLLRGYSVNYKMQQLEQKVETQQFDIQDIKNMLKDHQEKIDFFVRTNQPPVEGVFFEGQIFDAYRFHDRFLILDDSLYHFGASFKDLGRRLFAFELMGIDKNTILNQL